MEQNKNLNLTETRLVFFTEAKGLKTTLRSMSLKHHLNGCVQKRISIQQFRMHPNLSKLSSALFYQNKITNGVQYTCNRK